MSTDFFINLNDLYAADVIEDLFEETIDISHPHNDGEYKEFKGTFIRFYQYPYLREVEIHEENNGEKFIHISCGGPFRIWLKEFLESNKISYEEV